MTTWPPHIPCSNPAHCKVGICDVHALVHGDYNHRPVKFCPFCKAWICESCKHNWPDRAVAALKVKLGVALPSDLPSLANTTPSQIEEILRDQR